MTPVKKDEHENMNQAGLSLTRTTLAPDQQAETLIATNRYAHSVNRPTCVPLFCTASLSSLPQIPESCCLNGEVG
jgi:hypothetical protein